MRIDDENKPIFRIFSLDRFLEILNKRKIFFVKPEMWDDPFENFYIRYVDPAYLKERGMELFDEDFNNEINVLSRESNRIEIVFGQCWTEIEENDAIWRIYNNRGDGIKVKSTPEKMKSVYTKNNKKGKKYGFVCGKVMYFPIDEIVDETKKILTRSELSEYHTKIRPLFIKRDSFEHEEEIRFILTISKDLLEKNKHYSEDNVIDLDIDPNELFEEVVIDPRMGKSMAENMIEIIRKLGYKNKIERSTLYDIPDYLSKIIEE